MDCDQYCALCAVYYESYLLCNKGPQSYTSHGDAQHNGRPRVARKKDSNGLSKGATGR